MGLRREGFIKPSYYEELIKGYEEEGQSYEMVSESRVIEARYNEHFIRLILETPEKVLKLYKLKFMNDKVFVTVRIATIQISY